MDTSSLITYKMAHLLRAPAQHEPLKLESFCFEGSPEVLVKTAREFEECFKLALDLDD